MTERERSPASDPLTELYDVTAGAGTQVIEVRLLGGLSVHLGGSSVPLPAGAASMAVAFLALRGAAHVEELTDVLWPEASQEVARRRLRNVLARLKRSAGPLLVRRADRIELADGVVVDHHLQETMARRVLAAPPGPQRRAAIAAVLEGERGPLLPELLYEEWVQPARRRAEVRRDRLLRALDDDVSNP